MNTKTTVLFNFSKLTARDLVYRARMYERVLVFVFIVFVCTFGAFEGTATANVGLTACPSRLVFTAPPDFRETKIIKISNCGSETVDVKADITGVVDKAGKKIASTDNRWLGIEPDEFELKPNSSRFVRVTASASPGFAKAKRFAAVRFGISGNERAIINVSGNVLSSITLSSQTAGIARFEIEDFRAGRINIGSPIEFSIIVRNTGKLHYRTKGKIEIKNPDGKLVSAFDLPGITINPGTSKMIKVDTGKSLPAGVYDYCLLYTSPSPRDRTRSRMPSSA
jgi:hypothetical protein